MIKINTNITEPQSIKLNEMKKETGLDKGEHIRRAIDDYIEKYDRKKE